MKKTINLKNMKETIVNYSKNQRKFDEIWDTFSEMTCLGFIDQDTWKKFNEQCAGWYIDNINNCVRDGRHCTEGVDTIIWKYTAEAEYKA